jgi:hypothetical protein
MIRYNDVSESDMIRELLWERYASGDSDHNNGINLVEMLQEQRGACSGLIIANSCTNKRNGVCATPLRWNLTKPILASRTFPWHTTTTAAAPSAPTPTATKTMPPEAPAAAPKKTAKRSPSKAKKNAVSDDKKKKSAQNRAKIDRNDPSDVGHAARAFHTSAAKIHEAIDAIGNSRKKVEVYVKKSQGKK